MLQRFTATAATKTARTTTATTRATAALVGAVAVLAAVPGAARAAAGAFDVAPLLAGRDSLTVTVKGAGGGLDGTFRLVCAADGTPDGGTHPKAAGACAKLAELAAEGQDPFAPPAPGAMCTMIYGGPATAHVTGTWRGRTIDADFGRSDGCAVARWNALVPVLPSVGATAAR